MVGLGSGGGGGGGSGRLEGAGVHREGIRPELGPGGGKAGAGPEAGEVAGAGWAWGSWGPLSGSLQFKGPPFRPCKHPAPPQRALSAQSPCLQAKPVPAPTSPQTGAPGPPPSWAGPQPGPALANPAPPARWPPALPIPLPCPSPPLPPPSAQPPPPQVRQPGLAGPTPLPLPRGHRCCGATMLLPRPGD